MPRLQLRRESRYLPLFFAILFVAAPFAPRLRAQQQAPASEQGASPFQVVTSVVGTKGKVEGTRYVVDHPQTTFRLGQDKQVIVYFEWKGPAGPHHLKGTWLDPSGNVNSVGTFDYVAPGPEFSGYWVLTLNPAMQRGMWALQAQIDGKPAGVQTFRITGAPLPPPAPTASQIYQQAMASTVFVVALDGHGDPIRQGSGFFLAKGEVATTFGTIDGASQIEIDLPDGSHVTTQEVLAWSRQENWALLELKGAKAPALKPAPANGWEVGGSCYLLSSPGPGARTIERVAVTGTLPGKVKRFDVSWEGKEISYGSPVLDSRGRVIGLLASGPNPMQALKERNPGRTGIIYYAAIAPVVPISAFEGAGATGAPTTLQQMSAEGLLIPPLAREPQVGYAVLCSSFTQVGQTLATGASTSEFYERDKNVDVVVYWDPTRKIKAKDQARFYDAENRLRFETRPLKISLDPDERVDTGWKIPISSFAPGVYRVDVLLGNTPQWRSYFRIRQ